MDMSKVQGEILVEVRRAEETYGSLHSTHEGYGVLAEEVAELLDAIRSNDPHEVRKEAVQVSAVALRLAEMCIQSTLCMQPEFSKRSGFDG